VKLPPRQKLTLIIGLSAAFLISAVGIVVGLQARSEAGKILPRVNRSASELQNLKVTQPSQTLENLERASANREELEAIFARITGTLAPRGLANPSMPLPYSGSQDLYLEIADFIEGRRRAAEVAKVTLPSGFQFGFARLVRARQIAVSSNPDTAAAEMRAIARQKEVVYFLTEALFEARPTKLESLARGPVLPVGEDLRRQIQQRPVEEMFSLEPFMSAKVPGSIEATAYRIVFEGTTETLRNFLSAIAVNPENLVVRGIEVEALRPRQTNPSAESSRSSTARQPVPDTPFAFFGRPAPGQSKTETSPEPEPIPLVQANTSRFTVLLEELRSTLATAASNPHESALADPEGDLQP
jgi:hypothetical protein